MKKCRRGGQEASEQGGRDEERREFFHFFYQCTGTGSVLTYIRKGHGEEEGCQPAGRVKRRSRTNWVEEENRRFRRDGRGEMQERDQGGGVVVLWKDKTGLTRIYCRSNKEGLEKSTGENEKGETRYGRNQDGWKRNTWEIKKGRKGKWGKPSKMEEEDMKNK